MKLLDLLLENKDHLINKSDLSKDKKDLVKKFFRDHPNLENRIDWNKPLKWEDFEQLEKETKTSKSSIKKNGLDAFIEGEDYFHYKYGNVHYYQPLNYKFTKWFQSQNQYGLEAKWCIGSNDQRFFRDYFNPLSYVILITDGRIKEAVRGEWSPYDGRVVYTAYDMDDEQIPLSCLVITNTHVIEELFEPLKKSGPVAYCKNALKELGINKSNYQEPQNLWLIVRDILSYNQEQISKEEFPDVYALATAASNVEFIDWSEYLVPHYIKERSRDILHKWETPKIQRTHNSIRFYFDDDSTDYMRMDQDQVSKELLYVTVQDGPEHETWGISESTLEVSFCSKGYKSFEETKIGDPKKIESCFAILMGSKVKYDSGSSEFSPDIVDQLLDRFNVPKNLDKEFGEYINLYQNYLTKEEPPDWGNL